MRKQGILIRQKSESEGQIRPVLILGRKIY
jgi:hypothetical protein